MTTSEVDRRDVGEKRLQIEINEQFQKALQFMENTSKNVFVTGKAGTGKSTLLNLFRTTTRKKIVVLAPTGVAALNVQGETIHSFFGFKPDITLEKIKKIKTKKELIYKEIETIVIDEISMVRADLLDYVDRFLRLNAKHPKQPFGGVQLIFIGDLYQLPPVVTGKEKDIFQTRYQSQYFFDAEICKNISLEFVELEKVYRQKDESFIRLLNAIRNNTISETELAFLNQRVNAGFSKDLTSEYPVHLTATNKQATEINNQRLAELKEKIFSYSAVGYGDFEPKAYPTDQELKVCVGAQVMLLNNDAKGRWVNGSLGKIAAIKYTQGKDDVITVQLANGALVEVLPYTWEIFHFLYNRTTRAIETEAVGSFTQYPLRLSWAVTIHKSQGKTFEQVNIDIGRGVFAHGQMYVALSRCTSFAGITLAKPVRKTDIFMDWRIVAFLTHYQYHLAEKAMPLEERIAMIENAIQQELYLEIVYLKTSDVKTRRVIKPLSVGEKHFLNKPFLGVESFCLKKNEERMFRIDRILEMRIVEKPDSYLK